MPIVSVSVPHSHDPADVKTRAEPHIEKMVDDFEGHDLDLEWTDYKGEFSFKSMAFTINGDVDIETDKITVSVDLPLMAMIFKDKVEEAINKNLSRAVAEGDAESEAEGGGEATADA